MSKENVVPFSGAKPSTGYRVVAAKKDEADIYIYGPIGGGWYGDGVTAARFAKDLKDLGDIKTLNVRFNSEGGSVFEGRTMHTLLVEHKAKVIAHIDGLAASAASFMAMAANEIRIAKGAFVMIHNAWTWAAGDSSEMRRQATLLDAINDTIRATYVSRTKNTDAQVKQWMDDETWLDGPEALKHGFADIVVEDLKAAAFSGNLGQFRNVPQPLKPRNAAASALIASMRAAIK